jgi:predicted acyl esterase
MEYTYEVEYDHTTDSDFPFPQFDLYDWYLKLGSLKNVNEKYFHGSIPTWNNFVKHPNYDSFWQDNSPLSYVSRPEIPQLHIGG